MHLPNLLLLYYLIILLYLIKLLDFELKEEMRTITTKAGNGTPDVKLDLLTHVYNDLYGQGCFK